MIGAPAGRRSNRRREQTRARRSRGTGWRRWSNYRAVRII